MTESTVSIVIATRSRPAILHDALLHLAEQAYPADRMEVLVVDDGGDESICQATLKISVPFAIEWLRQRHRGLACARNHGIRKARGDIIILLDDDMLAAPGLVSAHMEMHGRYENAIIKGNVKAAPGTTLLCEMMSRENFVHRHGARLSNFAAGGNVSLARKNLISSGLYDERFTTYGWEGTELHWKLISRLGLHMRYCEKALVLHDNPLDFDTAAQNLYESGKSMILMLRLHPELMAHHEARAMKNDLLARLQKARNFVPATKERLEQAKARVKALEKIFHDDPSAENRAHLQRIYTKQLSLAFREGAFQALRGIKFHSSSQCAGAPGASLAAYPLEWRAFFFSVDGYGQSARDYISCLSGLGCPVKISHLHIPPDSECIRTGEGGIFSRKRIHEKPRFLINQCHPDQYVTSLEQMNIGFSAHETTVMPDAWISHAQSMDELWVTSSFVREAYLHSGIRRPIHVIPLGVNCSIFRPCLSKGAIDLSSPFVFLATGSFYLFKGFDVIIRAYMREFSSQEGTLLILRTSLPPHAGKGPGFIRDLIMEIARGEKEHAPILLMEEPLTIAELADMITISDAFISASRGEGFGLAILEAMACQRPVVATAFGGAMDYLTEENSFLLDFDLVPASSTPNPFNLPARNAHRKGLWAEPSFTCLRNAMRQIFNGGKEIGERALKARQDVLSKWTLQHAALRIIERLKVLDR
jgi:glycosyltransferase involved in cell wall biosynthesis